MGNENISNFVEQLLSRHASENGTYKNARYEGYRLLIPVIEHMREMGLSTVEIGHFFNFLGHEFCASALNKEHGTKPIA